LPCSRGIGTNNGVVVFCNFVFFFQTVIWLLQEMVTVSVDGSVLDRIAKIMSYLRLGSSGKVLKKKKKERDTKGMCFK
jgi:hypothetical protein